MTDKELLELAAKAVDIKHQFNTKIQAWIWFQYSDDPTERGRLLDWNPLTDDGDALRLAVKLKLCVATYEYVTNQHCYVEVAEESADPYAATRRAIVRAAAEIGKGMK